MIIGPQRLDLPHLLNPIGLIPKPSHLGMASRANKNQGYESSKVSFTIKCYNCQGYGHLVASCHSLVRITIIDGTPTEATESSSDMFIFKGEEDSETDEDPTSDYVGLNCIN